MCKATLDFVEHRQSTRLASVLQCRPAHLPYPLIIPHHPVDNFDVGLGGSLWLSWRQVSWGGWRETVWKSEGGMRGAGSLFVVVVVVVVDRNIITKSMKE